MFSIWLSCSWTSTISISNVTKPEQFTVRQQDHSGSGISMWNVLCIQPCVAANSKISKIDDHRFSTNNAALTNPKRRCIDEEICPTSIGNTNVIRLSTVSQTEARCFGRNPWYAKSEYVWSSQWEVSSTRPSQNGLEVAWIARIHVDNKSVAAYTDPGCLNISSNSCLRLRIHGCVSCVIVNAAWFIIYWRGTTGFKRQDSSAF